MGLCDIGVIGLAVMGQNLILNISDRGFKVAVFNRTVEKIDEFLSKEAKGNVNVCGAYNLQELVSKLKSPRLVLLMIKAGPPIDQMIEELVPILSQGDVIIDGGNSHFSDTKLRCVKLEALGLAYVGCGFSGGEEGARTGPSILPGGSPQAWPLIKPIFQAIAAKVDGAAAKEGAGPCCDWIGAFGAGHYVKMIHNAIEYADMQLIAEIYHVAKAAFGFSNERLTRAFSTWGQKGSPLESFLIDITALIFQYKEPGHEGILLDQIRDSALQKGTGKWAVNSALDYNVPCTLFSEAVFARTLSSLKEKRVFASKILSGPVTSKIASKETPEDETESLLYNALFCGKIVAYSQGFSLLFEASQINDWNLNLSKIAELWTGGCIIRSVFLHYIRDQFACGQDQALKKYGILMLSPFFQKALQENNVGWRAVVSKAVLNGIPVPVLGSSLSYYDAVRTERLPANLLSAQRDYFGAHTYELEKEPGVFYHTNWTGKGGDVSASVYHV